MLRILRAACISSLCLEAIAFQPVTTLGRGRGGHGGVPSLVRLGVVGPRGGQNQSPKIPDKVAITPIASRPGAVVDEGEGESLTSSLWEGIWYNCDALTRRCLGNALDEPKYRVGVLTVAGLTLLFASNSPALHSLYTTIQHPPPAALLNAGAGVVAAVGMLSLGDFFNSLAPCPVIVKKEEGQDSAVGAKAAWAGAELGVWKAMAATLNLFGLALTSASHGAFLIQLTTLIVPLVQGIQGVPIARQIWVGVALAISGLFLFTNDPSATGGVTVQGDLLCVLAAVFYATYDLRLFHWGKVLGDAPAVLIRNKVLMQASLSVAFVVGLSLWSHFQGKVDDVSTFFSSVTPAEMGLILLVMLWNGLIVNALASVFQVGAQQAVGPARAQILYATGPLWSALMSAAILGEREGGAAVAGGALFMAAVLIAATAPPPESVCEGDTCEA